MKPSANSRKAFPRLIALGAAMVCLAGAASPALCGDLRIFVTNVTLTAPAASPSTGVSLSYSIGGDGLNVPGALQSVDIKFTSAGGTKTVTRYPGEAGALPGANTVLFYGPDLPPPGVYTVSVVARGVEISATDYFEVSASDDSNLKFTNANGIDINRVPGGVHHGLIYVAEGAAGTVGARTTQEGVYVLNPDLTPMYASPRAANADIGTLGPWAASTNSPFRVHVAPDERLYITDASDAHSALFVAAPDATNVQAVFAYPAPAGGSRSGTGLVKTSAGTSIYGSVSSVWVEGAGATRTIYTTEEDLAPGNSLWVRTIPADATATSVAPTLVAGFTGSTWIQDFVRDSLGNSYMVSTTMDDAHKFGATGSLLATLPPNSTGYYGISIDEPRDYLFLSTTDGRVFRASTAFNESEAVIEGLGSPVRDVATDAEGWVYALDGGNQRLRAFAGPGDYTIAGGTGLAQTTLEITPDPLPGDIAPVGPAGIYITSRGVRYGDGKVDLLDADYIAEMAMGLIAGP
ncbi:MAG TPA: hypothetical protein VGM51_13730 [Armatimonadota bacterium]